MDSSTTNKSKTQQLHDANEIIKNEDVNLPATLTELSEINQSQQRHNVGVPDERKIVCDQTENPTSSAAESLELGCNDDGLIVIQNDVEQIEEAATARVFKEEKPVARTK